MREYHEYQMHRQTKGKNNIFEHPQLHFNIWAENYAKRSPQKKNDRSSEM